jgi:hypothetical protein
MKYVLSACSHLYNSRSREIAALLVTLLASAGKVGGACHVE